MYHRVFSVIFSTTDRASKREWTILHRESLKHCPIYDLWSVIHKGDVRLTNSSRWKFTFRRSFAMFNIGNTNARSRHVRAAEIWKDFPTPPTRIKLSRILPRACFHSWLTTLMDHYTFVPQESKTETWLCTCVTWLRGRLMILSGTR